MMVNLKFLSAMSTSDNNSSVVPTLSPFTCVMMSPMLSFPETNKDNVVISQSLLYYTPLTIIGVVGPPA